MNSPAANIQITIFHHQSRERASFKSFINFRYNVLNFPTFLRTTIANTPTDKKLIIETTTIISIKVKPLKNCVFLLRFLCLLVS